MKIAIIGTGYVGLCTGVGFASRGHEVLCVDIDQEKVDKVNNGVPPIYEPGLEEMLKEHAGNKLKATTDIKSAVKDSEVVFVCVGTPSDENNRMDLKYVKQACIDIGNVLKECDYRVIVIKSTVIPESVEKIIIPLLEESSGKKAGNDFGVCMNPEFLREGSALKDFLEPDRTVIGEYDKRSGDVLEQVYSGFGGPTLRTNIKVAELIKYANNAFLATKISFSNEMGNICKRLGVDAYDVMNGVGMDHRFSPLFFSAGAGWGGSCFPKDVAAIVEKGKELSYDPKFLEEVININKRQKVRLVEQLENKIGDLKSKRVAVLGLSFKPDTDDIREASSIDIIKKLIEKGAVVSAYDPKAMELMRKEFPDINYAGNSHEALRDADACLIVTEWNEFKALKDEDFNVMRNRIILEGRKVLNKDVKGFEGICW
ncbi:MAG: UDP-glucose/GDP-mannose dehydrogenase family protein [Candidatus Aenigmatarchaeota archaeon]|nr:UDP-glucose/GDP-mannose dehydrogenase family protein [Nanoarchaeota archaeon]